ncbi:PQQ-binding-like beta-propeller repeat protein [Ideonella livida]|uniref:PQQ-binding-like beta-propeller repeat protein n=1 Tax=Ideonella livida TaxID=2707176 RepID=UPI00287377B6|nr:PQQ-binding-like beta-propeller repeat protein [Ideonella livida]
MLLLGACASSDRPKPAELQPLVAKVSAKTAWQQRVGGLLRGGVALKADQLLVASDEGEVQALDLNGTQQWRVALARPLATGPGYDGQHVAVVTQDQELQVLTRDGVKWRDRLGVHVATPPLVAGERVFVQAVDRSVHAFDVRDGHRLWTLRRPADPLTLSQFGVLTAVGDTLVVGHASRLLGVDPLNGQVRWEVLVASPRGTNEVERLADLVGPVARDGRVLCMRAFQNAVGCVDTERAAVQWSAPMGGVGAVAADREVLASVDGADRIVVRRRNRGEQAWLQEALLYRGLGAPALLPQGLLVGDTQGWLHLFSREAGDALMRMETDGSAIRQAPMSLPDGRVLVVTSKGSLLALQWR